MLTLKEYITNESILDNEEDLLKNDSIQHSYEAVKILLENEILILPHKDKKVYNDDPNKYIMQLLKDNVVKATKKGSKYVVDLNFEKYDTSNTIYVRKESANLPIIINNFIGKMSGGVYFKDINNIPVNFIPASVSGVQWFTITIESKRYSLDLSKRSDALSNLNGCFYLKIENEGGVTADLIKWNNNPITCNLTINTKFDNKTVCELPAIQGGLNVGKTGIKYYMNKLNLFTDQNLIKQVFGKKCSVGDKLSDF